MAYAGDILNTISSLDLETIVDDTLKENTEHIADLNASQLAKGLRADDSEISPPYADATVFEKERKSGLAGVTDHVTLYDTGDHYREMYAAVVGRAVEYGSKDEKSEKLQKKYGNKIYGLSTDSKEELEVQYTRPTFQRKVEEQTGLKFS